LSLRPKIKAAIFDLGNVLVDVDAKLAAVRVSRFAKKSPQEIYGLFFESQLTKDFEEGKISPEDLFLKVKSLLDLRASYEEFLTIWNQIFFVSENNRKVAELVIRLSADYRLAMVTNTNILHYNYLIRELPGLFTPFHHIITSFEAGARKPEPAIYRRALSLLKADPEETFYTDDRAELVDAANRLGIRGSVFTGFEKLNADLAGEGVQTDAHSP